MEHLPVLVFGKITGFLTAKDLGACCATNKGWRDIFNQDHVWRPLCDQVLAAHLKVTECQVKPKFVSPEPEDSSLSPICEWRLSYMREVHLRNNWKRRRFSNTCFGSIRSEGRFPFMQFVNNNLAIIKLQNNRKVMLWDVSGTPLHLSCPATLETHKNIDLFEVLDDEKILFLQFDAIQMFSIPNPASDPWAPLGVYHLSPLREAVKTAFVADNKCIAVRRDNYVEVFDLKSFKTLEMSDLPERTNDHVFVKDVISSGRLSKDFAVVLECQAPRYGTLPHLREGITVYVYSIQKLSFLQFKISIPHCEGYEESFSCVIHENTLAIFNDGSLTIHNYITSEVILRTSNVYHFCGLQHMLLGFSVLSVQRFSRVVRPWKEDKKPALFLETQNNNMVPLICHCLQRKQQNLNKLIQEKLKDTDLRSKVMNILILIRKPKIVINEVHTKMLNVEEPGITFFW